ncbi:5,6-dimethylbenzimidazole synthase [Nitrospirillum bahiense]|uniref:Cob(II)yrinic acid a,c-diamide reductase n=1 Tax=Nitrospirillum amazonense TaxID=28077 RepID=A0A560FXL9_9PROT|nr:5,6-dimethylbenzimidazole synthase [Nitrospirillum amazonense]TWB26375.1 cob(II)yrinic acid a,c-diamide reductase [Nitrospirillum amazonense]
MTAPDRPCPDFDADFRSHFRDLLVWRRDVRRFRTDPLPDGLLERLLDLACLAPSVGLSQPWRFVRVDDPVRRDAVRAEFERCNAAALAAQGPDRARLYASLKLAGLREAPCHLAVFIDPDPAQGAGLGRRTMPETLAYSAVAAIQTLWLAARVEGIGLGWVSILRPEVMNGLLAVPAEWRLVGYLCIGYPAEPDDVPELERVHWEQRHPLSDVLFQR